MTTVGIDLGDARTGVALSRSGLLTSPYCLIEGKGLKKTAIEVADIMVRENARRAVIGKPLNMDGSAGARAEKAEAFLKLLQGQLFARKIEDAELILEDERLSTVEAHDLLDGMGYEEKEHRRRVDMLSAQLILERFLERKVQ